jgi:hypothetical protein
MSGSVGSVTIDLDKVENVRVAVGISAICHSIPEIQSTSGLQSAILIILNCATRPTSGNVGSVTISSGMVENVGKAVGISVICHSIPEIQCTSGLVSAILKFASRPTSRNDGWHRTMLPVHCLINSGKKNVVIADGILLVTASFRHSALFHASATILAAI